LSTILMKMAEDQTESLSTGETDIDPLTCMYLHLAR